MLKTNLSLPALGTLAGAVLMVAPKAAVLIVAATGLYGLYGALRGQVRVDLKQWPLMLIGALILWAFATSSWALEPSGAVVKTMKVGLVSVAGVLALAAAGSLSKSAKARTGKVLLSAVLSAALTLIIGQVYAHATGDALWGQYSENPFTTMNNGAAILVLLVWPATAVLLNQGQRLRAVVIMLAVVAVVSPLSFDAALLALAVGSGVFILARKWGRGVSKGLAGVAGLVIVLMPLAVASLIIPENVRSQLGSSWSSVTHRLLIWEYSVEKIKENPLAGWGMDAARHLGEGKKVMGFLELMPLHPHNGALQVWLELGLPGAVLAAALAASAFLAAGRRTPQAAAAACAACAGYLVIGSLSYGVWQTWWVAVAWILTIVIRILDEPRTHP